MQESYKVLIVDDDLRLRSLLERYLTEQGFQIRTAANADQMDRLLTRESIHLIVLDLMLPGEDGLSICRRLRSQNNPIPIIMVTAKGKRLIELLGLKLVLMITSQNHLTQENYSHVFALFFVVKQMNYRAHLHKITPLSLLVSSS